MRFLEVKRLNSIKTSHTCDSGVKVIMAASQAVDPGSIPGCRKSRDFLFDGLEKF